MLQQFSIRIPDGMSYSVAATRVRNAAGIDVRSIRPSSDLRKMWITVPKLEWVYSQRIVKEILSRD